MGFPLSYQFEGKSENIKYKLIGNAVCCPLASCFAKEILIKEELSLDIKKVYIPKVKFNLNGQKFVKKEQKKKINSKYSRHIPYLKLKGVRVELTNKESNFKEQKFKWLTHIHKGSGKKAKIIS